MLELKTKLKNGKTKKKQIDRESIGELTSKLSALFNIGKLCNIICVLNLANSYPNLKFNTVSINIQSFGQLHQPRRPGKTCIVMLKGVIKRVHVQL